MQSRPQSFDCGDLESAGCTGEVEEMEFRCWTAPTGGKAAGVVAVWEDDAAPAVCFCAADHEKLSGWFPPCSGHHAPAGHVESTPARKPPRVPRRTDDSDLYEFRHHSDIRRYIEDYRDRGNNKKRRNEQLVSCLHKAMLKAKQSQEHSEIPAANNKYRSFHPLKDSVHGDHGNHGDHGDHNHSPETDFLLAPDANGLNPLEENAYVSLPKLTSRKSVASTRHSVHPTRCGLPQFQEVAPLPILTNGMPCPLKVVQEYSGGRRVLRYDLSDVVRARKIPAGRSSIAPPLSWSPWDYGSSPSFSPSSGSSGTDMDSDEANFPRLRYSKGPDTHGTFAIDGRGNLVWHADRRDPAKNLAMQRMYRRKPNFGALTSNKGKFTGDSRRGTSFSTGISGNQYRTTEQHRRYFQSIARSLHEERKTNVAIKPVKNDR